MNGVEWKIRDKDSEINVSKITFRFKQRYLGNEKKYRYKSKKVSKSKDRTFERYQFYFETFDNFKIMIVRISRFIHRDFFCSYNLSILSFWNSISVKAVPKKKKEINTRIETKF